MGSNVPKVSLAVYLFFSVVQAYCCQCGFGFHAGESPWEVAKRRSDGTSVVFEGTVDRLDLRWNVLDAKEEELIPADSLYKIGNGGPHMVVTFTVNRTYRGNPGLQVQVNTGLGGGDCGGRFVPGFKYLVYLYGSDASKYEVGLCSPGGWVDGNGVTSDLRYLRGEKPAKSDLAKFKPYSALSPAESASQEAQRKRNYARYKELLWRMSGKVCGTMQSETRSKNSFDGSVFFLSTRGYSPGEVPVVRVNEDGSFCSEPLAPGKYYLQYTSATDDKLTTSLYYPGVIDHGQANQIEVKAGETHSGVVFNVIPQKSFSVRGFLSTNEKARLGINDVSVVLFPLNDNPRFKRYSTEVNVGDTLPFLRAKYFNIENVLPGRYVVYVSGPGPGWFTKKRELTVDSHDKIIWLELIHKK